MKNSLTSALLATTAVVAALGTTVVAADASSAPAAKASTITVAASDTSVSSGEQFVLTGRLSQAGVVRIASQDASGWQPLDGAVVHTRRDGTYSVRIVLSRTGDRVLRALGDPDAAGVRNSTAKVTVHVS